MNKETGIERIRKEYGELSTLDHSLVDDIRQFLDLERSGVAQDVWSFIEAAEKASKIVHNDPSILDKFQINLENGYDPLKDKQVSLVERILWYRANPWKLMLNVVGLSALNRTAAEGSFFKQFTKFQKKFLRDFMDPRVPRMLFTANRGASKTWLAACGIYCYIYLVPKIKLSITSGSQEQSNLLYQYFKTFIYGTPIEKMIQGAPLKTRTNTITGGWVTSFPASEKRTHGPRPDISIIDEACKADSGILLGSMSASITSHNIKYLAMSTPDKLIHIFRDWWIAGKTYASWKLYHTTAFDCPWITNDQIRLLTELYGGKDTPEYKIYILGEFAAMAGTVYNQETIEAGLLPILDPDLPDYAQLSLTHYNNGIPKTITYMRDWKAKEMVTEPTKIMSWKGGFDAGGAHPTALVVGGADQGGNVYVVEDWERKINSERWTLNKVEDITKRHPGITWYADAAPIQWYLNRKLRTHLADIGSSLHIIPFQQNKGPMITNTRGFLEAGMMFFYKRACERLVNELMNYAYDETTGKPQKHDDDHVDAWNLMTWGFRNRWMTRNLKGGNYKKVHNFEEWLEENETTGPEKDVVDISKNIFKGKYQYY